MVSCYAEKDGLHVLAYYEHWSVNEKYKITNVYSWNKQEIHQQIMRRNVLLHVKTTVTPICHYD